MALPPHSRATTPLAAVPRAGLEIRVRCSARALERHKVPLRDRKSKFENRNSKPKSNAISDAKIEAKIRPEKPEIGLKNRPRNPMREAYARSEAEIEAKMRHEKWQIGPENRSKKGPRKWLRKPPPEPGLKCPVFSPDFRASSFEFRALSPDFRGSSFKSQISNFDFPSFGRVAALGLVLGYTAFQWGGVRRTDQYVFLLALGLLAMACSLARLHRPPAPLPGRAVRWAAALLPAYVLLQVVPLPLAVLRVASPVRAQAVQALDPVGVNSSFAPLSVSPAETFRHFLLLSGYVVVFLLVRELAARFQERSWLLIWPIVTLAALEAGLGIWQNFGRTGEAAQWGTYVNHNHYAGFLEMALPFAVIYPVALLRRARRRGNLPMATSLAACGVWGLAGLMLAGIANSLSRMGFIATLGSLLVMGALAFGNRPLGWLRSSRKRRWGAAGMLALALLAGFAFLPSERLILRFAELTSSDPTGGGRAKLWAATIPLIRAYPVFGCGLGGYETAFLKFKTFDPLIRDDFAHNDYLQLLAELGLAGFAILAAAACSVVRSTSRQAVVSPDPEARYLALACAGALAAILLHSLADFNLYIPANAMLLAWIAGLSPQARPPSAILNRWEQLASGPAQGLRAA